MPRTPFVSAPLILLATNLFLASLAAQLDAPARGEIVCDPNWGAVAWETRYDQAKLAHIQLDAKSSLPGQLAAITKVDATFKPSQSPEIPLSGGWEHGYVFDNWDQLLKQLEASVGGISIKQTAFNTENAKWQVFAIPQDQQNVGGR